MIEHDPHGLPVTISEAQAYLRLETGEEEAVIAALLRSATGLCEAFTGQCLIARTVRQTLRLSGAWQRLGANPVRSIAGAATIDSSGVTTPLEASAFAIDIDRHGDGWVRLTSGQQANVMVTFSAGMAADGNGVPEPLRQGILRLAAHLFHNRDGEGGEPPAAVTALWRPYRRMRLS